jgi:AcrR family transcriptional regulator
LVVARPARERILEATYDCVARYGIAKTTVEDAARQAGVARATVYRHFPGGKDQLIRETVGWEAGRFFDRLATAVGGASSLASLLEELLVFGHRAVEDHAVLQKILETEPELLLPQLTVDSGRLALMIQPFLLPWLAPDDLAPGVSPARAADYLSRMILSLIGAQGSWDLTDREQVRELVRDQLLPGVLT